MMGNQSFDTPAELEQRIGRALRQLGLDSGYGQEELAARANVSRTAVQTLEAGRGSRPATLVRVLGALDRLDLLDALRPRETVSPMEALAAQRRASRGSVAHPRVYGFPVLRAETFHRLPPTIADSTTTPRIMPF